MPDYQDILSIGFDYKQTESDAAKVLASMREVLTTAEKLNSIKFGLNTGQGFADSKKSAEDLNTTLKEGAKIADEYSKKIIASEKALQAEAKTREASNKAKKESVKLDQEVIKQLTLEEKAEQEIIKTQKLRLQEAERQQKISAKEAKLIEEASNEYRQLGKALQDAELKYKNLHLTQGKDNEQTQAALKNALAIRNVLDNIDQSLGNYQRNVGNYGSAFNGLNTSIQQILREAPSAAVSLNTFFLAISNNLPMFFDELQKIKAAQKEALIVAKEAALVARESATAQALQAGATKEAAIAEGLLAEKTALANAQSTKAPSILSQIGKSLFSVNTFLTLGVLALTLFGGKIVEWVGSLFGAEKAIDRFKEAHKNLIDTMNEAAKSSAKEVVDLRVLEKAATDVNKPMTVRLQAVNDLQKKYPQYLANISDEAILHGDAVKQINLVAEALYKKAFAEAASSKAATIAGGQLDLELRRNFLLQEQAKSQAKLNQLKLKANDIDLTGTGAITQSQAAVLAEERHLDEINKLLKANGEQAAFNGKQIKFFTDKAAENIDGLLTTEKVEKVKKGTKTISDALKELDNELKGIQSNQDNGILTIHEADVKRAEKIKGTIDEIFKLAGSDAEKNRVTFNLSAKLNPISLRLINDQIKDFVDKTRPIEMSPLENYFNNLKEAPGLQKPYLDKLKEDTRSFVDEEAALYDRILQRELVDLSTQGEKEQIELNKRFAAGKISREDYQKELVRIQETYAQKAFAVQLKWLNEEIDILPKGTRAREDAEKKLADVQLQYIKQLKDAELKSLEQRKQGYQQLASQIVDLFGFIIENGYDKEKDALTEQQRVRDKNYQRELENIQNSTLSLQEKSNATILLQAEQDAAKKVSDDKQTELDRKKSRTQKLIQAAEITGNAVQTVFKLGADALQAKAQAALLASNPLTAAFAPIALASAAAIGAMIPITLALAGAQIAKLVIPKYAKGLKNNPVAHIGEYGEAGAEWVKKPGEPGFLATSSTIDYLPKGTDIIPLNSDDINRIMYGSMMAQTAQALNGAGKKDKVESILLDIRNDLKKNGRTKRRVDLTLRHNSEWEIYRKRYYS